MSVSPPPIQEQIAERQSYLAPQTWIRWFQLVEQEINELIAGGSGIDWGDIGGTLSDQTDLQVALDAKDDLVQAISTISTSTTINDAFRNVLVNASSSSVTVTLPAASTVTGRYFNIKKIDSSLNTVVVDANSSETIDGALTATITTQYECITIVSNGTAWFII